MSNTNYFTVSETGEDISSGFSNCPSRDTTQVTIIYDLIQEILVLLKIDSTGLKLTRNEDIGWADLYVPMAHYFGWSR